VTGVAILDDPAGAARREGAFTVRAALGPIARSCMKYPSIPVWRSVVSASIRPCAPTRMIAGESRAGPLHPQMTEGVTKRWRMPRLGRFMDRAPEMEIRNRVPDASGGVSGLALRGVQVR